MPKPRSSLGSRFALASVILFLVVVFFAGGTGRAGSLSQIVLRSSSIVFVAIVFVFSTGVEIRRLKSLWIGLCLIIALMLFQLIPIPQSLWSTLPGRHIFVQPIVLSGPTPLWRPISLAPDATLNSLLSTLPLFATLAAFSVLRSNDRFWLLSSLIALIFLSGLMGVVQLTGQAPFLYFYGKFGDNTAVGFFANRNHQSATLCAALPMLAAFATTRDVAFSSQIRLLIALFAGVLLLPLIVVTGSRTGLLLLVVGTVAALMILRRGIVQTDGALGMPRNWWRLTQNQWVMLIALAAVVIALIAVIAASKATAIQRAFVNDIEADARLRLFWPILDMLVTYFPFGTGFGSFSQVFKIFEPFSNLEPSYFNNAHNDVLELVIEAGLPGALMLLIGAVWWVRKTLLAWQGDAGSDSRTFARAGSAVTLIFGLASLTDYPLRTPICSVIFLLACCFMAVFRGSGRARKSDEMGVPTDR